MAIAESKLRHEGKFIAVGICWILGCGSLISWNSMLTIMDYYYHVFPDYHPSRVLTLVYQPFAFGTMAILAYNESKIDTMIRNILGYTLLFLGTLALLLLDLATSGGGGIVNYLGICLHVALLGFADALVQGGMIGDLSLMCPEFLQSFVAGLAASGVFTSALCLLTKAAFNKSQSGLRKGAMLFLAIPTLFEFACIILCVFIFDKLPIMKHYRANAAKQGSKTVSSDLAAAGIYAETSETYTASGVIVDEQRQLQEIEQQRTVLPKHRLCTELIFHICPHSINLPKLDENIGSHQLGSWYKLVLIAVLNLGDFISRYIPAVKGLKMESLKGITILVISHFFLIPAFFFTAKYGDQGWMIMLVSVLGLTNGYLTVCIVTAAPKWYKAPEQNALGNLLVLFLLGGIFTGVALDWLWLIASNKIF